MTLRTGHLGLNVTDLDRSLAFYRDVLGFSLMGEGKEEDRRYAFLGTDGQIMPTRRQQGRGADNKSRLGLLRLALGVETVERVKAYEAALRGCGVEFAYEGVVAHREGSASGGIFFHDPDGTRLEIYTPSGVE